MYFRACSRGELGTGHKDHHGYGEFCHSVGILSGSVHHHDSMGSSGRKVHVVVSGAGTHHDLQLLCSVEHLGSHLVGTDDERIGICHGFHQVGLLGILLQQGHLVPGFFKDILDPRHRYGGKGFLGCDQYFHFLRASNSFIAAVRASTSSWVQAL